MKINISRKLSYFSYLQNYQNSVVYLFKSIDNNKIKPEEIIFPLMFLIRHSLELGYKSNIRFLSKYSKINDFCGSGSDHRIKNLHNALKNHLELAVNNIDMDDIKRKELKTQIKRIDKFSNYFKIIDNESFAFRYPTDTNQKPVFPNNTTIDINEIKKIFNSTMSFLRFLSEFIIGNINTFDERVDWPMAGGVWNDDAVWDDSKIWNDGI